jgi:hypothetical protein
LKTVPHSVHEKHLMFNVCLCYTPAIVNQKMITQCTKERDESILLSKKLGYQNQLLFTHTNYILQWGMLQWTNATRNRCINKIRILQQTQILQRTRRYTFGLRSTCMRMMCQAFPLWLEHQSSSLLSFVRFGYKFSLVIRLFVPLAVNIFFFILLYNFSREPAK